jgi:hypothetical protein
LDTNDVLTYMAALLLCPPATTPVNGATLDVLITEN